MNQLLGCMRVRCIQGYVDSEYCIFPTDCTSDKRIVDDCCKYYLEYFHKYAKLSVKYTFHKLNSPFNLLSVGLMSLKVTIFIKRKVICELNQWSDICELNQWSDICELNQWSDICEWNQWPDICEWNQLSDICEWNQWFDICKLKPMSWYL